MTSAPSRAVMLFGTEEPVVPPKLLRAGPLTCELEAGNLRYIRVAGKEALRALSFIVRDKDWGTYNPKIDNLEVSQGADGFAVSYDARCKDDVQELTYKAKITGAADGSLAFEALGTAVTDFLTNRTGFVILHPIEGVAGEPVEILHVDGTREHATFPALIDPVCPFQDVRALTHEVLPGVKVTCTMEGDAFETEDHRNWNDASYKTYVRPLAKPWPYMIKAGETTEQSVRLALDGQVPQVTAGGAAPVRVTRGRPGRHHAADRPQPAPGAPRGDPGGGRCDPAAGAAVPDLPVRFAHRRRLCRTGGGRPLDLPVRPADRRAGQGHDPVSGHGRGDRRRAGPRGGDRLPGRGRQPERRSGHHAPRHRGGPCRRRCRRRALRPRGGLARVRPEMHPAGQHLAALSAGRGDLRRGARGVSWRAARRRHVLLLHRAQPQAAAGRPSRLRGAHDLPDRARLRRPHGDGEPRGAAAHHPQRRGVHPRQAVPGRPEQHRRARQSVRRRGDAQPRQRARRARRHGPAPARPVGRRLEPRLRRAHGARPRRCGLPVGADRRVRRRLCPDGLCAALVRPAGPGRLSGLPRAPRHGRGRGRAVPRDHALGRLGRAVGRLAQPRGHRALARQPHRCAADGRRSRACPRPKAASRGSTKAAS